MARRAFKELDLGAIIESLVPDIFRISQDREDDEIRIAMSVGKENEEARTDVSANGHYPSLKYELRDQLRIFYRGIFARGSVGPHAFAGIFLT